MSYLYFLIDPDTVETIRFIYVSLLVWIYAECSVKELLDVRNKNKMRAFKEDTRRNNFIKRYECVIEALGILFRIAI